MNYFFNRKVNMMSMMMYMMNMCNILVYNFIRPCHRWVETS